MTARTKPGATRGRLKPKGKPCLSRNSTPLLP
jgi:hypothetical protein